MKELDVVLLTENKYINPVKTDAYVENIIIEDSLVQKALEKLGCNVQKIGWDDKNFDWSSTQFALFRTTWDYFYRFKEFKIWLDKIKDCTKLINSYDQILWNLDKNYLKEIAKNGINIPPTHYIQKGTNVTLKELHKKNKWENTVLKPTISGAARHTYKLNIKNLFEFENTFNNLIQHEDFMLQEFQYNVVSKGEVAFMLFNGEYSHAILKKAKQGDFRVQDDFGGTVHEYNPSKSEIEFAIKSISFLNPMPIYARVDMVWDNYNKPAVSELELIEPELWFRFKPESADLLAKNIVKKLEVKKL